MELDINWLAVAAATLVSMVLAKTWFEDWSFGLPWRRMTGVTPEDSERGGKLPIIVVLVVNILTAITLAALISLVAQAVGSYDVWVALAVGISTGLVFSVFTLLTHNLFEQKPFGLTLINGGFQLVMFVAMSTLIGLMGVA